MKEKVIYICDLCNLALDSKEEMEKHEALPILPCTKFKVGDKPVVLCNDVVFNQDSEEERQLEYIGYKYGFNHETNQHNVFYVFKDPKWPGMIRLGLETEDKDGKKVIYAYKEWCYNQGFLDELITNKELRTE